MRDIPFTAEDALSWAGQTYCGYTYHFSRPVYARMKIWDVNGETNPPQEPQTLLPPTKIVAFTHPANEFSASIHRWETREKDPGGPAGIHLEYQVTFNGRQIDRETAERIRAAYELFAPLQSFPSDYNGTRTDATIFPVVQRLMDVRGQGTGGQSRQGSGVRYPEKDVLMKLVDDLTTPSGAQRAAEAKAKWQAETESKFLNEPVEIYYSSTEATSFEGPDKGQVKRGVFFVAILEFSVMPFPVRND